MICDNCANSKECKRILQLTATMCGNFCDSPIAMEEYKKITSKDNIGNIIYYLFVNSKQKTIYIHTGALYKNSVVIYDSEFTRRMENLSVRTYNTIWFTDREILDKTLKDDYKEFELVEIKPDINEQGILLSVDWVNKQKEREGKMKTAIEKNETLTFLSNFYKRFNTSACSWTSTSTTSNTNNEIDRVWEDYLRNLSLSNTSNWFV